jgi:hypothetical protein
MTRASGPTEQGAPHGSFCQQCRLASAVRVTDDLNPYFTEFLASASRVAAAADEAAKLHAEGDVQGACNAMNVMHYRTSEVEHLRQKLVADLERQGYSPGLTYDESDS